MSEKTTILDKLPRVAGSSETIETPKTIAQTSSTSPSGAQDSIVEDIAPSNMASELEPLPTTGEVTKEATKADPASFESTAETSAADAPEITISAIDSVTYYGLFAMFLFFLLSAIIVFSRRAKVTTSAPQKALLLGGSGLAILAIYAFASKSLFAQFLNQTIEAYPLWLKPLSWIVIAPMFVMTIPYLVTESAKAHKFFVKCAAKAAAAFVVLAIPSLVDLGSIAAGVFAAISIGLGVFFTLPLVKALRRLPGSLATEAKSKISQLGFVVIGMIILQIITGSLALVNVATTPVLLIDLVMSFGLITVILMNLMSYISIQFPREATA
ncbi:MAG: hypothetical protein ACPGN3_08130 [Opitutales bacterium]